MASRVRAKKIKKRAQRATSNVFAMFDQGQIQEFKEVCKFLYNIELSHWYKVDKVFYTPEAKLRGVKITSYITKRS